MEKYYYSQKMINIWQVLIIKTELKYGKILHLKITQTFKI